MKGKILLVVGLGVGYVLGSRAGREKYDELVARVQKVWNDPRVQKQASNVGDFVKEKAPDVADFLSTNVKKATSRTSAPRSASARAPRRAAVPPRSRRRASRRQRARRPRRASPWLPRTRRTAADPTIPRRPEKKRSLLQLLADIPVIVRELVEGEIELLKQEMIRKLRALGIGAGLLLVTANHPARHARRAVDGGHSGAVA